MPPTSGTWRGRATLGPSEWPATSASWLRGKLADLVLLRRDSIFLQPVNHPLAALVYAENGSASKPWSWTAGSC